MYLKILHNLFVRSKNWYSIFKLIINALPCRHTQTNTQTYTQTLTHTHMHTYKHMYTCIYMHTSTYIRTCIHAYLWLDLKNPVSTHNHKYLEIPILIIWNILAWEGKQMLAWNSPKFYTYLWSIYSPAIDWIASWIAHYIF